MLKSSSLCLYSSNLGTFCLKIQQFWPFEEISILINGGHLGYKTALTDTILKGINPGTIPARFGLIWFNGFRGEDLNVIFYQNMSNLHNRYIGWKKNFTEKPGIYLKLLLAMYLQLKFSLILTYTKGAMDNWKKNIFLVKAAIKIGLICIIGIYRLRDKFHRKTRNTC